jgi:UDP-N-acetylmuramoyl-tripeptide--D-alanyl-D-alanine ligase
MNSLPLDDIAVMCRGTAPTANGSQTVRRICKDTRTLVPGDLYFALKGDNFDGNRFVEAAAAKGAAAAVVEDPSVVCPPGFPLIVVEDGLKALHSLAEAWRDRLALKVVCITGSNGKTSTKEFAAAVLSSRFRTVKTQGNLNNHVGLPLSILAAEVADGAAVWEIGMNHPGEIAPLAALARPDVGIVTNIGVAHIEYMGSREAIAAEKSELLAALRPDGTAIFPASDDFAKFLATRTQAGCVTTGAEDSEVRAENIEITSEGTNFLLLAGGVQIATRLPVPGLHMVSNALLAVAAGLACGLSPEECAEGLEQTPAIGGRLMRRTVKGIVFLDDSYNANPDSMSAAIDVLKSLPCAGKRIAVLGRMGELGTHAEAGYRKVGSTPGADILIAVGPETAPLAAAAESITARVHSVPTPADATTLLRSLVSDQDIVLVKGSRSARMETVIDTF